MVGGAADGLAEVDIAADWDLADGDRLKIALRVGEIAGEREDGICLSGENEGHDVKILGENGLYLKRSDNGHENGKCEFLSETDIANPKHYQNIPDLGGMC